MLTAAETLDIIFTAIGTDDLFATEHTSHVAIAAQTASAWDCLKAACDAYGLDWMPVGHRAVWIDTVSL